MMITGVVLIASVISKWIPTNKNRFYRSLVLTVFCTAVFDLSACLMEMYSMDYVWWGFVRHLFCSLYFCFHIATGMCYLLFVLSLANVNAYRQRNRILVTLPVIICTVMMVLNLFVPVYFYYDAQGVYHQGPLFFIQYLLGMYYVFMIFYVIYKYREPIGKSNLRVIIGLIILVLAGVLVQSLKPGFLIGEFLNGLTVIFIYVLVENADEIKDERYGILTRSACLRMANLNVTSKVGFKMIFVHLTDSQMKNGKEQIHSEIVSQIVKYILNRFREEVWVCYWSDDCLVLDYSGKSDERAYEIMDAIESRFRDPWVSGDYSQTIGVCMWLIRCPEDVKSIQELTEKIDLINSIGISRYRGILNLEEIDFSRLLHKSWMERSVQSALKNHTAKVLYEPVYCVREKRFVGARSVIFFPDEEGNMVNGNDFLNASDTTAMLAMIDEYAFEDAAKHMKLLLGDTGLRRVSTRLSIAEITKPGFNAGFRRRCERYNADFRNIVLRISGGTQVRLPKEGIELVHEMCEEGWRFAMDDFGYGLSILDRMAVSEIPMIIMHPLVTRATLSGDPGVMMGCGLLYTIHGLNKTITLTGILTEEDAELAANIGADYLCGPYFSNPLPAEELAVWLKERDNNAV